MDGRVRSLGDIIDALLHGRKLADDLLDVAASTMPSATAPLLIDDLRAMGVVRDDQADRMHHIKQVDHDQTD